MPALMASGATKVLLGLLLSATVAKPTPFHFVLDDGIRLNVVRAVQVAAWEPWGPLNVEDQEAYNRALLQGRMISIEPEDFQVAGLRIADATVYETQAGDLIHPRITWMTFTNSSTPVRLLVLDADGSESSAIGDRGIAIVFDDAEVWRDGRSITTDEFLALGEAFWQSFGERAKATEDVKVPGRSSSYQSSGEL